MVGTSYRNEQKKRKEKQFNQYNKRKFPIEDLLLYVKKTKKNKKKTKLAYKCRYVGNVLLHTYSIITFLCKYQILWVNNSYTRDYNEFQINFHENRAKLKKKKKTILNTDYTITWTNIIPNDRKKNCLNQL